MEMPNLRRDPSFQLRFPRRGRGNGGPLISKPIPGAGIADRTFFASLRIQGRVTPGQAQTS